ncbi:T9SS type B sorting domain-containing protein [Aquimarina gracilis]|uniref:T9SS type B sorting domain-containing protein n=1 Tax=Aquimarina gracilis TaxID=874422 RepID=A0ABU5ZSA1_9FLAO|nr:T9SS type B sorting domain-containing protein [Aquimarina gracilis]MEB3344447.1 T9SS type B sorting domain-containing protein [Aquimarina gracilis]
MKRILLISIVLHSFLFDSYAQNEPTDCSNAIIVCGNTNLELNSNGVGINDFALPGNNAPSCNFFESQSLWIKVNIVQSGTLVFTITPESASPSEDYDFAIYGPNVDCSNLGSSIRCSSTNPPAANVGTLTGLRDSETDVSEGPGALGNGFVRPIDVLAGEEYFILIDNFSQNGGFDLEFTGTATFPDAPVNDAVVNSTDLDLAKCDDTGDFNDGLTTFNLDANTPLVQGPQTNVIITYHASEEDANIGNNPLTSPHANTRRVERIYVRVENLISGCFVVSSFLTTVFEGPQITTPSNFVICDNNDDGDDANGLASFILNTKDNEILNGLDPSNHTITYHISETDANNGASSIDKNLAFNNTTNPQTIFARIEDQNSPFCVSTTSFDLQVNLLPEANTSSLSQCDAYLDTNDGITLFNLNEAIDQITGNTPNRSIQFFEDLSSANSGTGVITNTNNYQNTIPNQQLYVRVIDDNTSCFNITTLDLDVSTTSANDAILRLCDDDGTEDGFSEFDLTLANNQILSGIGSSNLSVAYFQNIEDALSESNPISAFTNNTAYTQGQDIIFARVENSANQCFGINQVELFLNRLPDIQQEEEYFLCQNEPAITIDSGLPTGTDPSLFSYFWSTGDQTETISITQAGSYMVTVTNIQTNCSRDRIVEVIASSSATIQSIVVNDAQENNTVTINADGLGDYEYAIEIDGTVSAYQDNPTFMNIPPGFHIVFVRDKNGCLPISTQNISVVGFPKYFTPNGDGFHETWNVEGISIQILSNSLIYIFDRFGKLIKQLRPGINGWDGTFNGRPMPSSEYWYRVELEDGRTLTGSFSLIR